MSTATHNNLLETTKNTNKLQGFISSHLRVLDGFPASVKPVTLDTRTSKLYWLYCLIIGFTATERELQYQFKV